MPVEEGSVVEPIAQRYVGSPVKRSEDTRILTGRARYVDDITLPGMLHAAFVRSPFAHARIRGVRIHEAREASGVVAVLGGAELESLIEPGPVGIAAMIPGPALDFSLLCTDKVRVVGDPIAIVVAESRYQAEDACELVEVDFEELPTVTSAEAALDSTSPVIFENHGSNVLIVTPDAVYGDVDGAFARADRIVRARIRQHRHQNVPMEGRGLVADFDPTSGMLTVHISTQGVHMVRGTLADRLGMEPEQVRVLAGDVGGSFGLKIGASREDVAVAVLAKQLGRPVKWIEDRSENLTISGQAREESFEVEAAVTDQGDLLALKVQMLLDAGAYPGTGIGLGGVMQAFMPGPYKMEGLSFGSTIAITNKASYVAYRGPWAAETFIRERMINLIAAELGMDPYDVRLRNVATRGEPPDRMVTGLSLAGVTGRESLERIAEVVDLPEFRRRQEAARAEGRCLGIGMATYVEAASGRRADEGVLAGEALRTRLETDGTVVIYTGQMPHGQSHQTTLAQVAADQLHVPFEQVRVVVGDTDLVPAGMTGGSRAATMAGGASLHAARQLRTLILEAAGALLEASPDDLEINLGQVSVRGVPARAVSLAEVARAVETGQLEGHAEDSLEVAVTYDGGEGGWSGGTHCAEVEVDSDTGRIRILRYVVAEDCGELINPAIVAGQVRGGVAQGVGAVLLERSAYDESGQFLSASFMDYLLPTAVEVPRIEIEHLQGVSLDADVNWRGIGEGGLIVSPATICNAIEDALSPFGTKIYEQHLPPARILELIGTIEPDESVAVGAS
jgi:carbon-monoxide dehydrogenase large subunit